NGGFYDFESVGKQADRVAIGAPVDLALDKDGNLYIADATNGRVKKVDKQTKFITFIAGATDPSPFNEIRGISLDGAGTLYGDGGPASSAALCPAHLEVDARNNDLYIADYYSSRVRKIDAKTLKISTVIGSGTAYYVDADFTGDNGPATAAKLNFPFELSGIG